MNPSMLGRFVRKSIEILVDLRRLFSECSPETDWKVPEVICKAHGEL